MHRKQEHMGCLIAILVALLAGCQPTNTKTVADAEKTQAQVIEQAQARQSLRAFGGVLVGKNEGEWGGEVAFHEPDGTTYTVIADNSHGIFQMPYGVVALTGLAHMDINRGAVHTFSRAPGGRVSAAVSIELPGAPCDVVRTGDRIDMRIRFWKPRAPDGTRAPVYECYALVSPTRLVRFECPLPASKICFG